MKDKIEILFREYDAGRSEILNGLSGRNTILSIGIAGLGVIFTLACAFTNNNAKAASIIFMLGIPAIASCVLFIWMGEYKRVQTTGKHMYRLEARINAEAGADLLTFEKKRRNDRVQDKAYRWDPVVGLMSIISLVSVTLGLLTYPTCEIWIVLLAILLFGYIAVFIYARTIGKIRCLRIDR